MPLVNAKPASTGTRTRDAGPSVWRTRTVRPLVRASARGAVTRVKALAVWAPTARPSIIYHYVRARLEQEEMHSRYAKLSNQVQI